MSEWFGASWEAIGFVAASTVAMYATLLVAVRLAGRRTLAQLSAFDVLVTVALGTLLSSTIVSQDPSYLRATTATVTLLSLQVVVAAARRRSTFLQRLLEFEPEVVARNGELDLPRGVLTSQLSEGELRSLLRQQGVFEEQRVGLVILEPTGKISVTDQERPDGRMIPDRMEENDRQDG